MNILGIETTSKICSVAVLEDESLVGEYILKINGENNYLETYFFSIEKIEEETRFIDFVQRVDILVLVVVLVSGGIILKKK